MISDEVCFESWRFVIFSFSFVGFFHGYSRRKKSHVHDLFFVVIKSDLRIRIKFGSLLFRGLSFGLSRILILRTTRFRKF